MNAKVFAALMGVVAVALCGCPPSNGGDDAGADSGDVGGPNPDAGDECPGGCPSGFKCDGVRQACVEGCNPTCVGTGGICAGNESSGYACVGAVSDAGSPTTCSVTGACQAGQTQCIQGNCSCRVASGTGPDSCYGSDLLGVGKFCDREFNTSTNTGGACRNPVSYEQCKRTDAGYGDGGSSVVCTGGDCAECGSANDPNLHCAGHQFRFSDFCLRTCARANMVALLGGATTDPEITGTNADCDVDEICLDAPNDGGVGTCVNSGLFFGCEGPPFDGGVQNPNGSFNNIVTVTSGARCITTEDRIRGAPPASGTCSVFDLKFASGQSRIDYCHSPGTRQLGQTCKRQFTKTRAFESCAVGLECVPTNENKVDGVCLKSCNAALAVDSYIPRPECGAGEQCANFLRYDDVNGTGITGACMKSCDVYDAGTGNYGCTNVGTTVTQCSPVAAYRDLFNPTGQGLCVPRRADSVDAGAVCPDRDALKGATCAAGQICENLGNALLPICQQVCDVECSESTDGGPPRCLSADNVLCPSGTRCLKSSTRPGARLGICVPQ